MNSDLIGRDVEDIKACLLKDFFSFLVLVYGSGSTIFILYGSKRIFERIIFSFWKQQPLKASHRIRLLERS